MRKGFNFYVSYWEQMKLLNDKQKVKLLDAICQVQFLEINIEDVHFKDNVLNIVWAGIKHSLATSLSGFINKKKGLGMTITEPLAKGGAKGLTKGGAQQEEEKEQVQEEEEEEEKVQEEVQDVKEKFSFRKSVENLGVSKEHTADWLVVRKNKKASNTETAFKSIKKEIDLCFEKFGITADDCIKFAAEKDWKGFKTEWYANANNLKGKVIKMVSDEDKYNEQLMF